MDRYSQNMREKSFSSEKELITKEIEIFADHEIYKETAVSILFLFFSSGTSLQSAMKS